MRVIFPPTETAAKLCGSQKNKAGKKYRFSNYAIQVPCEDGTLFFHTLTGELCLIRKSEKPEEQEELLRGWFLVPEEYDELKQARDFRQVARLLNPPERINHFNILTTTDCNARCYYCYEKDARRVSMTDETAHETAAHIQRVSKGASVSIHWFGGEPLFNRKAIELILADLRQKGVSYKSSMTSNGFYLDAETARTAAQQWHMKSVQITLDGTREAYNRTKAYIDRQGDPFNRVLNNIEAALDEGIDVDLRLNMSMKNCDDLLALTEQLAERFSGRPGLRVYPAPLTGPVQGFPSAYDKVSYMMSMLERIRELNLFGRRTLKRESKVFACLADDNSSEVIMPDGNIVMCEVFDEEDVVGHVTTDNRDPERLLFWKEPKEYPECATCPVFPRCKGLKNCPWVSENCPPNNPERHLWILREDILTAYHDEINREK